MKKIVRVAGIVFISICLIFVVSGCGIIREVEAKNRAQIVLKERYGEEFIVKDEWGFKGTGFMGLAYPKRDKTLLF